MLGTIVNVAAIFAGCLVGMIIKKGIPQRINDAIMIGIGLCVTYIGIDGALEGNNALITILSMVIGGVIGELCDLDGKLNTLGGKLEAKLAKGEGESTFAQGFVTATLIFCVGAMAIVGALQSGLEGDHTTLFTKSMLDGITSIVLSSTFGLGVALSVIPVFIYQGGITLLAGFISPYLSDAAVSEMTCVGSLLIVAIGLNMLKITDIKIMNYIPGVIIPVFLCMFM